MKDNQGLTKTKQLIREKVWFPGIDSWVKREIEKCLPCQANSPEKHPEPLQMTTLPPAPWHTLHVDFCGPFPTGEYLLVVIDAYSRFPEVEIVRSTSAATTIPKLERIFATHGIPTILCSDNGPPFTSHEFKEYTKNNGIKTDSTTLANGSLCSEIRARRVGSQCSKVNQNFTNEMNTCISDWSVFSNHVAHKTILLPQ